MHIPIARSNHHRVFAGVLGGLADHYGWDPALTRVIFVVASIAPIFPGLLVYLILWLLMEPAID